MRIRSPSSPALLPATTPVLLMSTPVRRGAVADARLGLVCRPPPPRTVPTSYVE